MTVPVDAAQVRADVIDLLQLSPEEFSDDDDLIGFGLDSLRLIELAEGWRERLGVRVSFEDLAQSPTVASWVTALNASDEGPR